VTATGSAKMGEHQASLLKAMMHVTGRKAGLGGPGAPNMPQRPNTAACSTVYDESRVKNKLRVLEDMQNKLDDEMEKYFDGTDQFSKRKEGSLEKGVRVNKSMLLEAGMVDEIEDIKMVRDSTVAPSFLYRSCFVTRK